MLDELEECIPAACSVETAYEEKELSAAIVRFLDNLSYEDRFCFVRRCWYGDAVSEIAAMTHSSSHRISVRLFRTREKLRKTLKKEGLLA